MAKNIVILCDGTSNEVSSDRTNILRLFGTLKKDETQVVFYDPGVGTFGADDSPSYYWRKAVEIWGLATGWGLDQNVLEAYRFIAQHYDHQATNEAGEADPDRLYLFGFSRGAYTARVLAGFIHAVGIIPADNINLLPYAYRAYKDIGNKGKEEHSDAAFSEVRLFERMLRPVRPTITFLGLFDTVGSVIESGRRGPRLRSHAFTRNNTSVAAVRHAVAIDERRTMFEPQLWPEKGEYRTNPFDAGSSSPQDIKEVWFTGVHGDVGGGYPESASALAKLPLHWMIEEARQAGLHFKTRTINSIVLGKDKDGDYVAPDPHAERNTSMNRAWRIVEYIPRRKREFDDQGRLVRTSWYIPNARSRTIPDGACIHASVQQRIDADPKQRPGNLPGNHCVES